MIAMQTLWFYRVFQSTIATTKSGTFTSKRLENMLVTSRDLFSLVLLKMLDRATLPSPVPGSGLCQHGERQRAVTIKTSADKP